MIAALPRLLVVRLLAALLLVVAGLQAGAPMGPVLERTHGSAFSASTHDVAVAASRRTEVSRVVAAPQPVLPVMPVSEAVRPAALALGTLPAPRPDSTGPPPRDMPGRPPSPRGPPRA